MGDGEITQGGQAMWEEKESYKTSTFKGQAEKRSWEVVHEKNI